MSSEINYPKLRYPLNIRIERIEENEVILIHCPLGISKAPLALVPAVGPVIACFEGRMSHAEILAKFSDFGLTAELLNNLIKLLDDNLFLATARFFEAQSLAAEDFKNAPVRSAALAGGAYSKIPAELEIELDRYLAHSGVIQSIPGESLVGVVSPHIDYRRGQITYGKTYSHLKDEKADIYILIGTAHQYSHRLFHLSAKDFDTPLGILKCDREFMLKTARLFGEERSFAEEILHKQEHSLELQAPFLKRLQAKSAIAPILVGSFGPMLASGKLPEQYEEYDRFVESLVSVIKESRAAGKSICFVAGIDMAHVGRHFGDNGALTPDFMEQIAERDRQYLDCIQRQNRKDLFSHIAEDTDARRICGFPTMYTVIDCFDRLGIRYKARLYEYRQSVDYKSDCAVTFAGMGLYL